MQYGGVILFIQAGSLHLSYVCNHTFVNRRNSGNDSCDNQSVNHDMYTCMYVCMCVCMYVRMHMYVCMYVHVYVCIHMYKYVLDIYYGVKPPYILNPGTCIIYVF